MYAVILAGGGGTRLWPLSSPERPKPFLPLLGQRTLLQLTADRLAGLVETGDLFVVTERRYGAFVRAQLPDVPPGNILAEPIVRNTAAAVALAALAIDRPEEQAMLVLPADHRILDAARFGALLRAAEATSAGVAAIARPLVTLGIEATEPAPNYGYIVPVTPTADAGADGAQRVERFVEKPDRDRAQALLAGRPPASWNAGIFCWQRGPILEALATHAPDVLDGVRAALGPEGRVDDEAYAAVRATSIDYAVLEPAAAAGHVAVLPAAGLGWSDLGSWTALLEALGAPGEVVGRVVPAGEAVEFGPDDLLVSREHGRLRLTDGPARLAAVDAPRAHLIQARQARSIVEALLEGVGAGCGVVSG